jgi:hypothetical protein
MKPQRMMATVKKGVHWSYADLATHAVRIQALTTGGCRLLGVEVDRLDSHGLESADNPSLEP